MAIGSMYAGSVIDRADHLLLDETMDASLRSLGQ
jgi:hypothetical protein